MPVFAGPLWRNGDAAPAWIRTRDGRIVEEGTGAPPIGAEAAVLLDGVSDLHTHIGDAFLRGEDLPRDLTALVAPGTGLKHRRLASTPTPHVQAAMRDHLRALARHGVVDVIDFREQGAPGVRLAREAAREVQGIDLRLMGRTTSADPGSEVAEVLRTADGLGIPSLTDVGFETCERLREAAGRVHRPFAMHASEGTREDMEQVLSLEPDLLVHLASATRADLRLVAEEGVPVVVCPSSNAFFGLRPPVDAFQAMGVEWFLGTDNAMFGIDDPIVEAHRLKSWFPDLPDAALLRALTTRAGKVLNQFADHAPMDAPARAVRVLPLASTGVGWGAPVLVLER